MKIAVITDGIDLNLLHSPRLGTVHELTNVMDKSVETSQMSLVLYLVNWSHLRRSHIPKGQNKTTMGHLSDPFLWCQAHLDLGALL